jgi:hypothetical protein
MGDNISHSHLLFECFCDYLLENILGIFFKKSFLIKIFLHTILLRFMLKNWQKMSFKKNQIHLQVFLLFKTKCYNVY